MGNFNGNALAQKIAKKGKRPDLKALSARDIPEDDGYVMEDEPIISTVDVLREEQMM